MNAHQRRKIGSRARALQLVLILGWMFATVPAIAQPLGKISGTVTDAQTGETLIGANVVIQGTNLGAATDERGNYFILQVPPGEHTIVASYIGYHQRTITSVEVTSDLTTRLDIALEPQTIESPELIITAEESMVQHDVTFTRRITSGEEMQRLPGIDQATDIFATQAGTVVDNAPQQLSLGDGTRLQVRDESVKNIHVRGGRGGEILFLVDGMPVTHPIYGGRSVLDLNVVDVSSIELLTGAFSAEYGQAQSGVVNISTRSGSDRFTGGVTYKTDALEVAGESFHEHHSALYLSGPEPLTSTLLPAIGIDVPGKAYFFASASGEITNTAYNNRRTREDISLFGITFPERQDNTGNLTAKVTYRPTSRIETVINYNGSFKKWSSFDWLWREFPNNMADYSRTNHSAMFRFRHTLSKSTFYNLNLGFLGVKYHGSLDGRTPRDFWVIDRSAGGDVDTVYTTIEAPQSDPLTGFFDGRGYESLWRDDDMKTYTVKADVISQINQSNLVKTGFTVKFNDLQYIDIQDGGIKLSPYGEYVFRGGPEAPAPPGPYKEFGQNRWVFNAKPIIGGAYVQDKFEKYSLIINAGARIDWFYAGPSINRPAYKEVWEAATGLESDWSPFKYKISPRFGISYPISLNTVLFFSYGHFNQLPELQFFYRDPYTGGLTGNPHLDYVETILYEFGLTHQFASSWAVDVKTYNKDIAKQVGTTQLRANLGLPVHLYDNNGYARARGIEAGLKRRAGRYLTGDLNYTVQWATGYSSSAFEDYIRSINDFPNPIRERRLGWDVRHQVVLQATLSSPTERPFGLFGVRLPGDWNLTVLSRLSSGQPYTPGTNDPVEAQRLENSETGPVTYSTDLKLRKGFSMGGMNLTFLAEVFNVFDQKNTQVAFGFNPWTGEPYIFGDSIQNTYQLYNWHDAYRLMDPRQFSIGRHIQFGIQIDW